MALGGEKQKKFQTFSPKSGLGRLQEVPNVVIWLWLLVFWKTGRRGEVVAYERWS